MKLKIKGIRSAALAMVLILSAAVGCQGNDGVREQSSSAGETSAQSNAGTDSNMGTAGNMGNDVQTVAKDTVIAVSMPAAAEGWDYDAARSAGDYLASISSDTLGYVLLTASTAEEQSSQLDSLVGENIHAAVVYPVDESQPLQGAANLKNSGVPVVEFNGELSGITADASVTMDEGILGRNAARSVEDAGCSGMDVLVFTNESDVREAERLERFERSLPSGISTVLAGTACDTSNDARQALTDWLGRQDAESLADAGAVFASGEDELLGVLEGLASYEATYGTAFPNLKIIVGCGSSNELLTWLKDNDAYSAQTWFYPSEAINTAIDLAWDITSGSVSEDTIAVEAVSADHDSAGSYMTD